MQEGTAHQKDLINDIKECVRSNNNIYALLNKIDDLQKKEEKDIERRKNYLARELKLDKEQVFPVSADTFFCADRAKCFIEKNGSLPDLDCEPWVEDFGKKAFGGSKWKENVKDTESVKEEIEDMLGEARFDGLLKTIKTKYNELPYLVLQSVIEKLEDCSSETCEILKASTKELEKNKQNLENKIVLLSELGVLLVEEINKKIGEAENTLKSDYIDKIENELKYLEDRQQGTFIHKIKKEIKKEVEQCLKNWERRDEKQQERQVVAQKILEKAEPASQQPSVSGEQSPVKTPSPAENEKLQRQERISDLIVPTTSASCKAEEGSDSNNKGNNRSKKQQKQIRIKAKKECVGEGRKVTEEDKCLEKQTIRLFKDQAIPVFKDIVDEGHKVTKEDKCLEEQIIRLFKDIFNEECKSDIIRFIDDKLRELYKKEWAELSNSVAIEQCEGFNSLKSKSLKFQVSHNFFTEFLPENSQCNYTDVYYKLREEISSSVINGLNEILRKNIEGKISSKLKDFLMLREEESKDTFQMIFVEVENVFCDHIENLIPKLSQPFRDENEKTLKKISRFQEEKQKEINDISLRLQKTEEMNTKFSQNIIDVAQLKKVTGWQKVGQQGSEHNNSYAMGRDNLLPSTSRSNQRQPVRSSQAEVSTSTMELPGNQQPGRGNLNEYQQPHH